MKPPVFIIGSPRSGTTLFRLMMTAHPAIMIPPECGFAIWWMKKYGDWNAEAIPGRVERFLEDLRSSRKIETWRLDFDLLKSAILTRKPGSYAELVSLVYETYGSGCARPFERWGDKNNFYLKHVADLHALFPSAQFIHIVRDGRDVACSYRELGRKRSDSAYAPKLPMAIDEIAAEWAGNIAAVGAAFQLFPEGLHTEIRYEDLVGDAPSVLAGVCAFLGETYSAVMLDYYRFNRERELEPAEFLQWKQKTLEPPTTGQVQRFATELTPEECGAFEAVAHEMLQRYRYL